MHEYTKMSATGFRGQRKPNASSALPVAAATAAAAIAASRSPCAAHIHTCVHCATSLKVTAAVTFVALVSTCTAAELKCSSPSVCGYTETARALWAPRTAQMKGNCQR